MAIRIYHPEHGYHNVYNDLDLQSHITDGWSKIEDKPVLPLVIGTTPSVIKEAINTVGPIVIEDENTIESAPQVEQKKGFKCDVCGKPFAMKMHLKNHLRSHKR